MTVKQKRLRLAKIQFRAIICKLKKMKGDKNEMPQVSKDL